MDHRHSAHEDWLSGLICSDDLEMGGVLKAVPIEQAAIGHIRAGGDLGLICHQEDFIVRAFEAMICEAERDRAFRAAGRGVHTASTRVQAEMEGETRSRSKQRGNGKALSPTLGVW